MMKKTLLTALLLLLVMTTLCAAETPVQLGNFDRNGRLNLRSEPNKSADVLGKYYAGVLANEIETHGEWSHISIFGRSGWVMSRYLLHPGDAGYSDTANEFGIPGVLVRPRTFSSVGGVPLYTSDKANIDICRITEDCQIRVLGVVSEQMLHVRVIQPDGTDPIGFVPITEIAMAEDMGWFFVQSSSPEQLVNIRQQPSMNGKIIGRLYPGAPLQALFDWHNVDNGWQYVTLGGIFYGYVSRDYLSYVSTNTPEALMPFVRLKNQTAARYSQAEKSAARGETNANAMLTAAGIFGDFCAVREWDLFGGQHSAFFLRKTDLTEVPSRSVCAWGTLTRDVQIMCRDSDGSIVPWEPNNSQLTPKGTRVLIPFPADYPTLSPYMTQEDQWLGTLDGALLPADAVELDPARYIPEEMTQG